MWLCPIALQLEAEFHISQGEGKEDCEWLILNSKQGQTNDDHTDAEQLILWEPFVVHNYVK